MDVGMMMVFTGYGWDDCPDDQAWDEEIRWFRFGPQAPVAWRAVDLAAHRVIGTVAGRLEREGCGANVLADPRRP